MSNEDKAWGIDATYDGEPTEAWFDDFGDTDGLTQCIPTKEWKDIMEKAPVQSATDAQVGGDHYKNQGIQPLEATFKNFGYEGLRASIYTKVGKYLTREKGTHKQDIEKAIHVLQMQLEFFDRGEK